MALNGSTKGTVAGFGVIAVFSMGSAVTYWSGAGANDAVIIRLEQIQKSQDDVLKRITEHDRALIELEILKRQRIDELAERGRIVTEIRDMQEQLNGLKPRP